MLVDSNVIVYSINNRSPKQGAAQHFLNTSSQESVFAQQNVLEALRILTHPKYPERMPVSKAVRAIGNILGKGSVVSPAHDTYLFALELIKQYGLSGNKIFDAYLVATMLSLGLDEIATDNERDFNKF